MNSHGCERIFAETAGNQSRSVVSVKIRLLSASIRVKSVDLPQLGEYERAPGTAEGQLPNADERGDVRTFAETTLGEPMRVAETSKSKPALIA